MNEHSAMTASSLNLLVRRDDGMSAGDDFGRRAVEPLHQRLDVSTADEAALDGKHDLLRAWIAGNRLELGTQQRVERHGEGLLVAAGASRSDRKPGARKNLLQIRRRRALPDEEARHLIVHAAEPDEVARVE